MSKGSTKRLAIVVGGGPAPGINGVIAAATIRAREEGLDVIGILDGFKWLAQGDTTHTIDLHIQAASRIHIKGGSILRTSRENPTKDPTKMAHVIAALKALGVDYLVTIGGDDTAYSASCVGRAAGGAIQVVHVPKTIDNDLPLAEGMPTFGYETARSLGFQIVKNLMEDSKTTGRWYFVVAMGRSAGHLALGICKAAGATLAIIPEEFGERTTMRHLGDIIEGSMLKRRAAKRDDGVLVIAEGVTDKLPDEEIQQFGEIEYDEFGHRRLAEIDLGRGLKDEIRRRFRARGEKIGLVSIDLGYELRCADPVAFDCEYTRNLGCGAVEYLLGLPAEASPESTALICIEDHRLHHRLLNNVIDPETHKIAVRRVNLNGLTYHVARKYMIRLAAGDFDEPEQLAALAEAAHLTPAEFKERFGYLATG